MIFFWILFGVAGMLAFFVMTPYISAIFLASVFAVLFLPVFRRFHKIYKKGRTIPAILTVLVALLFIFVPLIFFGILMFQEVVNNYAELTQPGSSITGSIDSMTKTFEHYMQRYIPQFEIHTSVSSYLETMLRYVATNLNAFFSSIVTFIIDMFIIVGAMFFFYRDGAKLHDFAVKWSPMKDKYDESIIAKLQNAISAVVNGALFVSVIQGFTIGIGFALFGLPNPVLWGVVSTIAALIPVVGTGLITIPAGLYLMYTGHVAAGIGMLLYGALLVGTVDNLIRPLLIKRGVDIHPFVILLSVLGGLAYFGPIGFLAGPITIAFFYALLDLYPVIVTGRKLEEGSHETVL